MTPTGTSTPTSSVAPSTPTPIATPCSAELMHLHDGESEGDEGKDIPDGESAGDDEKDSSVSCDVDSGQQHEEDVDQQHEN